MPMPTGVRCALKTSKALRNPSYHNTERSEGFHQRLSGDGERERERERKTSIPAVMDIFRKDHHKEKRNSLSLGIGRSKSPAKGSPKGSPKLAPAKPAKIAIEMESPPLIFYGSPTISSGALMSGSLLFTVTDPEITLQTFEMHLIARTSFKKPVIKDCSNCITKDTSLFSWKFLTEPKRLMRGIHTFPFSYLIPGHVPATSHSVLGDIDYILDAKAVSDVSDNITVSRDITIQRALMPNADRTSIRIFPPTNLSVRIVLPAVIHPIGEFPIEMSLTGVIDNHIKNIERRWRIRRMNWRIEETSKIISAACPKHAPRIGGEGKGIMHEEVRTIASDDMKTGWKTDFDNGGLIYCEWNAAIRPKSYPCCNMTSPTGQEVSHQLVLEIIVAEEQTAGVGKERAAPTGSARVLRMQFKLVVTERSGMGISWDEEMPPVYEDVPNSPPGYLKMDDFEGDLSEHEELDRMHP